MTNLGSLAGSGAETIKSLYHFIGLKLSFLISCHLICNNNRLGVYKEDGELPRISHTTCDHHGNPNSRGSGGNM